MDNLKKTKAACIIRGILLKDLADELAISTVQLRELLRDAEEFEKLKGDLIYLLELPYDYYEQSEDLIIEDLGYL